MNAPIEANEIAAELAPKEKLKEDLRVVVADADWLLKATVNQAGERITAARTRAGESLQAAKSRLVDARASAAEKIKVAAKTTDIYVSNKPWQLIGVAAVLGIALGVLISRR